MDPYSVLGVPANASATEIRNAYRLRAQLLHPDRHREASDDVRAAAQQAMVELNAAYDRLKANGGDGRGPETRRPAPYPPTTPNPGATRTESSEPPPSSPPPRAGDAPRWVRPPDPGDSPDDCAAWFVSRLTNAFALSGIASRVRFREGDLELLRTDTTAIKGEAERRVAGLLFRTKRVVRETLAADTIDARAAGLLDPDSGLPRSWIERHHRARQAICYPVAAQIATMAAGFD